jgi:hypothetical protein
MEKTSRFTEEGEETEGKQKDGKSSHEAGRQEDK